MSYEYEVVSCKRADGEPDSHGNVGYWITVTDGHDQKSALLMQRPDTPEPHGKLFGHLEGKKSKAGKDYYRFYKEQREPNGQTAATPSRDRPTPVRDERGARIERQAAWKVAAAIMGPFVTKEPGDFEEYRNAFVGIVDWLGQDLNKASAAGQVDSLPPGSSEVAEGDTRGEPPAPSQEPQEPPSQPQTDTVSPDTRAKITTAYKAYVSMAPDGPAAKQELQLFLNANDIPGFEAMSEAQASVVMAYFDDAAIKPDDEIPF